MVFTPTIRPPLQTRSEAPNHPAEQTGEAYSPDMRHLVQTIVNHEGLCCSKVAYPLNVQPVAWQQQQFESIATKTTHLENQIKTHPDVIDDYLPNRETEIEYNHYRIAFPHAEEYSVGLLINPCGANRTSTTEKHGNYHHSHDDF